MALLRTLPTQDKTHWLLHLNINKAQLGNVKELSDFLLSKSDLPNIHPCYIGDWLEHPELRPILEGKNG